MLKLLVIACDCEKMPIYGSFVRIFQVCLNKEKKFEKKLF